MSKKRRRANLLSSDELAYALAVAASYDYAEPGDPVIDDPVYLRFVKSRGVCLVHDPYGQGTRCTRERGHGGCRHVAEDAREVRAVWPAQEDE